MRRHRRAARRKARGRVGSPRKAGQRKPSGDLRILVDGGSPRLLAHRALTIDPTLAAVDLDGLAPMAQARDRRASYPLGVLLLRREISSLQHYAGRRYLGLFMAGVRGVGTPSILACLVSLSRGSHGNGFDSPIAELDIKARADYLAARRLLDQARAAAWPRSSTRSPSTNSVSSIARSSLNSGLGSTSSLSTSDQRMSEPLRGAPGDRPRPRVRRASPGPR